MNHSQHCQGLLFFDLITTCGRYFKGILNGASYEQRYDAALRQIRVSERNTSRRKGDFGG